MTPCKLRPGTLFAGMASSPIGLQNALGTLVPMETAQNAIMTGKSEQEAPPNQQKPNIHQKEYETSET